MDLDIFFEVISNDSMDLIHKAEKDLDHINLFDHTYDQIFELPFRSDHVLAKKLRDKLELSDNKNSMFLRVWNMSLIHKKSKYPSDWRNFYIGLKNLSSRNNVKSRLQTLHPLDKNIESKEWLVYDFWIRNLIFEIFLDSDLEKELEQELKTFLMIGLQIQGQFKHLHFDLQSIRNKRSSLQKICPKTENFLHEFKYFYDQKFQVRYGLNIFKNPNNAHEVQDSQTGRVINSDLVMWVQIQDYLTKNFLSWNNMILKTWPDKVFEKLVINANFFIDPIKIIQNLVNYLIKIQVMTHVERFILKTKETFFEKIQYIIGLTSNVNYHEFVCFLTWHFIWISYLEIISTMTEDQLNLEPEFIFLN